MKISIALCTYNGETYLPEQLQSIVTQARTPDELVICDDCSEDGTASLIERFARRVDFKVSYHVNVRRLGVAANFDRAISLCSGDLIVPCDQDDVWEFDKLAVLEDCFASNSETVLAFSDLAIMTRLGEPTGRTQWQRLGFGAHLQAKVNRGQAFGLLLRFNPITGAALAFRSSIRDRILPIPATFLHDEWIGLIASATGKVAAINRPLVRYRQHPDQCLGNAITGLAGQYQHARIHMGRPYFVRMVERTTDLYGRLSSQRDALLNPHFLDWVAEKQSHAGARVKMRDQALARWPLATGEALRGRYSRFGYGLKSLLHDLFL